MNEAKDLLADPTTDGDEPRDNGPNPVNLRYKGIGEQHNRRLFELKIDNGEDKEYILNVIECERYGWSYFLCNEGGEGMSLSKATLFAAVDDFFQKNF